MAAPLMFVVEFVTSQAVSQLKDLAGVVKSSTIGLAADILAPLSPTGLVTQIAQQGMGINSLASNLVSGGVGAMAGSRLGFLSQSGVEYNAAASSLGDLNNYASQMAKMGLPLSQASMDFAFNTSMATNMASEKAMLEAKQRIATNIAVHETFKTVQDGSKLTGMVSGAIASVGGTHTGITGMLVNTAASFANDVNEASHNVNTVSRWTEAFAPAIAALLR